MALTSDCLKLLTLRQEPFKPVPGDAFLYTDALLDSVNEQARRALANPSAIVFLNGENGSGRTTQLMRILGALPSVFELIAFRGRANTSFSAVEVTIRNHMRAHGYDNPERSIRELLAARNQLGSDQVIAIDDAQLLGTDIVRKLLHMRAYIIATAGRGPRLILVGETTFAQLHMQNMEANDLQEVTRLTLLPFNPEQTAAYLAHRLRAAGLPASHTLFDADSVAELHRRSGGTPAALNEAANQWLAQRCRELKNSPSPVPRNVVRSDDARILPEDPVEPAAPSARDAPPVPALDAFAWRAALGSAAFWRRRWFVPVLIGLLACGSIWFIVQQPAEREPAPATYRPRPRPPRPEVPPAAVPPTAADGTVATDPLAPAIENADAPPPAERARQEDLLWLKEQDDSGFTVQLIALPRMEAVQRFIDEHKLHGVRIIPLRTVVAVVFGYFPDRASARRAVEHLPEVARKRGYWIREIGDIKQQALDH